MPTIDLGDRLVTTSGRVSTLKRGSVPFSSWAGGGSVPLSGDGRAISYTQLYRTQPWIAAVINKLNRQIATLPLKVYEVNSQNDRVRVRNHPLSNLLRRPYERCGPVHLKQKLAFPALLHGNAVVAKYREARGGPVTELLPLDWRFLEAHSDSEGGPVLFWETTQTGHKARLAPDEIVHVAWDAPDSNVGVSPLQQLGVTIRSEDAAQRFVASSFANGGRPSGAVILPPEENADKEVRDEIRSEIQGIHGGVDNAFKWMVLGGGASLASVAHNAQEAELVQTRRLNREEVAAVYDVPPPMVGILDKATYSNINEQHRMLYTTVLRPWLTLIEETLQAQLIDPEERWEGLFVEFDLGEVLKGDPLQRARAAQAFLATGAYTINDLREMENKPKFDNPICDEPLIPVNNLKPVGEARTGGDGMTQNTRAAIDRLITKAEAGALESADPDIGRLRATMNGKEN